MTGTATRYHHFSMKCERLTTINVNAGVFTDSIGNGNTSASQFSWTYDNLGPTLATVQAVPTRSNNTTPT